MNCWVGGGFSSANLHNYRWIWWPRVGGYASLFPCPPSLNTENAGNIERVRPGFLIQTSRQSLSKTNTWNSLSLL